MVKKIAVYGTIEARKPVRQRYWKWIYHRTGPRAGEKWYKRRVWNQPKGRFKKVIRERRYEFHGNGRDLYRSVAKLSSGFPGTSSMSPRRSSLSTLRNTERRASGLTGRSNRH